MLVEVKVPQLSESVAEATLTSWHKKVGDYVKRDENLVDIETDKVVLETPAPDSGVLVKIAKADGGTVVSSEVIATIDTEGKAHAAAETAPAPKPAAQPASAAPPAAAAPVMPAAQKLAADNRIDTAGISGSGRGGRVTKGDVLQAMQPQLSLQSRWRRLWLRPSHAHRRRR
jgi:2-oxoglutarate dehydrogenase E2 component (dihydrolipoamide succinyltransferase)